MVRATCHRDSNGAGPSSPLFVASSATALTSTARREGLALLWVARRTLLTNVHGCCLVGHRPQALQRPADAHVPPKRATRIAASAAPHR